MEHATLYTQLVTEEHHDQLLPMIVEQLDSIGYALVHFAIQRTTGFPYICCRIKTTEVFSAQMIGFFVDIRSLLPAYAKSLYYLPVIVFPDEHDARFSQFIDRQRSLEHEIHHIQTMLDLIRQDPNYPEKSYRYGMNSALAVKDLPMSIDLEIFKLFYLEPPAMRADFAKGERFILMPFDAEARTVLRYDCDSVDEYVGLNIKSYVANIKAAYKARFENDDKIATLIDREVDRALARHGQDLFGPNPLAGLTELEKRVAPKFFLAIARKQFV